MSDSWVGGQGGIRTHGTLARTPHFECGAFNHSTTCPPAVIREQAAQGKMPKRFKTGRDSARGPVTSAARPSSRRSALKTVRRTLLFAFGKPLLTLSAGGVKRAGGPRQVRSMAGLFPMPGPVPANKPGIADPGAITHQSESLTLETVTFLRRLTSGICDPSSGRRYSWKASVTSAPEEAMNSPGIVRVLAAMSSRADSR